jgi:membrane protease YdiL (CAAX protease family)
MIPSKFAAQTPIKSNNRNLMQPNHTRRLLLIWIAIACAVGGAMWLQSRKGRHEPHDTVQQTHEIAPIARESELLAKIVVLMDGFRAEAPTLTPDVILRNAEPMGEAEAPFVDRLAHAVLVGKVKGWSSGVEKAKSLAAENDDERALRDAAVGVMEARAGGEGVRPDAELCARLAPKLGFASRVACGDPALMDEAWRLALILIAAVTWYVAAFVAGIALLIYMLVQLFKGSALAQAASERRPETALILGETFAIWLVTFFAMSVGAGALGEFVVGALGLEDSPRGIHIGLLVSIIAFVGSLVVLAYPALRGLGRAELVAALGLHRGRGFVREALQGVVCYLCAVPLLAIGLAVYALLSAIVHLLGGGEHAPTHPVVELFDHADPLRIVLVFLMASVAAPLVEETMFRGALYGHLRATLVPSKRLLSALLSAVASSFVFAVIHPQGALFVPALGGLAVGFCLFREVRGSLIAPMIAHGINNAVTLALGLSMFA